MSLCLCVLHKNGIMISADSRCCYLPEDNSSPQYAITDDCQKLYQVGDKVIFISGFYKLMIGIIDRFKKSENQSISTLENISQTAYEEWKIIYPDLIDCGKKIAGALVVATFENGKGVLYVLDNSVNDWKAERYEGENYPIPATLGSHAPDALQDLKYNLKQNCKNYIKNNVIDFYKMFYDIYSKYADEKMGGFMHFYSLSPIAIYKKEPIRIPDKKEIKWMNFTDGVHCHKDYGFQIDKCVREDGIPVWERQVYISNDGDVFFRGTLDGANGVFHGTLEAGNITSGLIIGGRII